MSEKIPDKIWLFRIIHFQNLEYILQHGIHCGNSKEIDPSFISIGDSSLIEHRNTKPILLEPYGTYGDYVAFYFMPLSPMLLRIKTGHGGITKRPQKDIIYVCCKFEKVKELCNFIFFDGHSNNNYSKPYKKISDLKEVDWSLLNERYWSNNEADNDRERRKQAELIAFQHVPVKCISIVAVYDDEKKSSIEKLVKKYKLPIDVIVKKDFYYY